MTDQTPQTEAGRDAVMALLARAKATAISTGRTGWLNRDIYDAILAIEAQARAEALDVEVLARAAADYGLALTDTDLRVIAESYRAILTGEKE